MSSLARYASSAVKVPAGRKFLAQPDQQFLNVLGHDDSYSYCFQKSDIDALVSSGFVKISDSLYSAKTEADLETVLTALDGLSDYYFLHEEYTAVDLGKTIRIGVDGGDNDVITMRLVKRTGNMASAGGPNHFPNVCYVVTGNRRGPTYENALQSYVTGTTPNNRSKKPFLNNGGYQPCVISAATFESILSSVEKISGSLYLAANMVDLSNNVLTPLDGNHTENFVEMNGNELSSIDLGKTIRVGVTGVDNDLLVFRLIKRTGNVGSLGEPRFDAQSVGYVCIASKLNQDDPEGGVEPAITGSTPNALEVKPQFMLNDRYEPVLYPAAYLQSVFSNCVKVSKSLYLATNVAQLTSVCSTLDSYDTDDFLEDSATTSVDLGRVLRFGLVGGESDLITFGYTKGQSNNDPSGPPVSGYVVIASKLGEDYNGSLYPSILGSAPRDS